MKTLAICLRTYPCEDDIQEYVDGKIYLEDIKIYHKGRKYEVHPDYYDPKFYKLI